MGARAGAAPGGGERDGCEGGADAPGGAAAGEERDRRRSGRGGAFVICCVLPAFAAAAFVAVVFWPGFMSADSVAQLAEARAGRIADWHPPIMAALWRVLDRAWRGPAPMLLLHELAYFGGVTIIAALRFGADRRAAAFILGMGLWPPAFALLGTVWKDVGLGVSLVAASALLLWTDLRARRAPLVAALPFLFYAGAVRHNGLAAVAPLACWAGLLVRRLWLPGRPERTGWVLGLALAAALFGVGHATSRLLVGRRHTNVVQALYVLDLLAVSRDTGRVHLPGYVLRQNPRVVEEPDAVPVMTSDPVELAGLARMWRAMLTSESGAYLRYRARLFARLLGLRGPGVCYPFHPGIDANALGVVLAPSALRDGVMAALRAVMDWPFFRIWIYALGALGVAGLAWRRRHAGQGPTLAITASGLCYLGPYTFLGPSCDFRYGWWTMLATLLGAVLLSGPAAPPQRRATEPPPAA